MTKEQVEASNRLSNASSITELEAVWQEIKPYYPWLNDIYQEMHETLSEDLSDDKSNYVNYDDLKKENAQLKGFLTTLLRLHCQSRFEIFHYPTAQEFNMLLDKVKKTVGINED